MAFALACTFVYIAPSLPTTETLHNKEMPLPLRILAHDGELISRFGVQRRIPVRYEEIPPLVRQAFWLPKMIASSSIAAWTGWVFHVRCSRS